MKDLVILMTPGNREAIVEGRKTMTRRLVKPQPKRVVWNTVIIAGKGGWCDGHGRSIKPPYAVGQRLYIREPHYRYGKWVKSKGGYKGQDCKQFVKGSGKCKVKVSTRYNDYCEEDDCPRNRRRGKTKTGKQAWRFMPIEGCVNRQNLWDFYFLDDKLAPTESYHPNSYRKQGWYLRSPLFMPKKFARTWLLVTDVKAPERGKDISEEDIIAEGVILSAFYQNTATAARCNAYFDEWRNLLTSLYGVDAMNKYFWPITFEKVENAL